jgi:phosphoribosylanthranilate isomerase
MTSRRAVTWVKICGTTSLADAQMSVAAGADALGFIFAPSPRHIDTDVAAEIVKAVSGEVETIGVFVNELPSTVAEVVRQVGLSGVQLHGDEEAEQLAEFRRELGQTKIIKTIPSNDLRQNSALVLEKYLGVRNSLDAMLLDSGSAERRGGTGVPFNWESAQPTASHIRQQMPLIIAGGLNSGNVAQALDFFQPWGVDVVSGVESAPGKKDEGKLRDFMAAVRQHILQ